MSSYLLYYEALRYQASKLWSGNFIVEGIFFGRFGRLMLFKDGLNKAFLYLVAVISVATINDYASLI
jgi:hypothetical protein